MPIVIVQGLGERLGFAHVVEDSLVLAEEQERVAQVEPQIDRLRSRLPRVG